MGKVFKALSRAETERPPRSLAALVVAEEETAQDTTPTDDGMTDAFDFMRFSLGNPAIETFGGEADFATISRRAPVKPVREMSLDVARIDPHLVAFYDMDPRAAEEFSKTAITMISAAADQPLRRVLIASAQHGEGRTCVALNLASALAQAKQRVLVVDTDMQRPSLLRLLGLEADAGIAEAVSGGLHANEASIKVMPQGFNILPLRERVDNSAEILAAPAFRDLLNDCDADYDFMLFDSAPLLDSNDASLLMKLTQATVMVIRPGQTNASHLSRAVAPLPEDNVFGVVLNRTR